MVIFNQRQPVDIFKNPTIPTHSNAQAPRAWDASAVPVFTGTAAADRWTLSATNKASATSPFKTASIRFGGNPSVFPTDDVLIQRFPADFQGILNDAGLKAKSLHSSEIRAEHIVWTMLDTLQRLETVNPKGKETPAKKTQNERLKQSLRDALVSPDPLYGQTEPNALQIAALKENIEALFDIPVSGGANRKPPFQNDLKTALTLLSHQTPAQANGWPALLMEQLRGDSILGARSFIPLKEALSGGTLSGRDLLAALEPHSPALANWMRSATASTGRVPNHRDQQVGPLSEVLKQALSRANKAAAQNAKLTLADFLDRSRNGDREQNISGETIDSLLLNADRNLPMSQIAWALQKAIKAVGVLPNSQRADDTIQASRQTHIVFQNFLNEKNRKDFSAPAFVQYLHAGIKANASAPATYQKLSAILQQIPVDASSASQVALDGFETACPELHQFGTNLVRQSIENRLPEALFRQQSTDRMMAVIGTGGARTNLLLNTKSGEGKTFAINALAHRLAKGDVPATLKGTQLFQLDLGALIAGSTYRGDYEKRAKTIFEELNKYLNKNPEQKIILFVDEIHNLASAGDNEGNASNLLEMMKAAGVMERKNLTLIGATTPEDWQKSPLRTDQAFQGRFTPLNLPSFTTEERLAILSDAAHKKYQGVPVQVSHEMLEKIQRDATAKWPENSLRHAIDLLALSRSLATEQTRLDSSALQDQIQRQHLWTQALEAQVQDHQSTGMHGPSTEKIKRELLKSQTALKTLKASLKDAQARPIPTLPRIEDSHIRQALAIMTGETLSTLNLDELQKIAQARTIMGKHIVGQEEALDAIDLGLREIAVRHKTGSNRNRPIVSMLLPGPTGVGKTEAAKVIAREFMNNQLIRIDMSDFQEAHSVSRFNGAPPGYVGYDGGGLVDEVRKHPQSVIVFDEIEKAHPDIFNLLLQILEEGELRDNRGQIVDFRNTIILMTSNLNHEALTALRKQTPSKEATSSGKVGNKRTKTDPALQARIRDKQARALLTADPETGRKGFRPEILGRIDFVVPFAPLYKKNVSDILDIRLRELNAQPFFQNRDLEVRLGKSATNRLIALASAGDETASDNPWPKPASFQLGGFTFQSPVAEQALPMGARDVRNVFENNIHKQLLTDLTFKADQQHLQNAILTVDYDPKSQEFVTKIKQRGNAH